VTRLDYGQLDEKHPRPLPWAGVGQAIGVIATSPAPSERRQVHQPRRVAENAEEYGNQQPTPFALSRLCL